MAANDQAGSVSDETTAFEGEDGQVRGKADRAPTAEEERAAEKTELDDDVAEHYRDAIERGANVQGEGQIDS